MIGLTFALLSAGKTSAGRICVHPGVHLHGLMRCYHCKDAVTLPTTMHKQSSGILFHDDSVRTIRVNHQLRVSCLIISDAAILVLMYIF